MLAALPGGDPLAAALAAGETPSPEMVAAAGKVEGMPRRYSRPLPGRGSDLPGSDRSDAPGAHRHGAWRPRPISGGAGAPGPGDCRFFGYAAKPADHTVWLDHRAAILTYLRDGPSRTTGTNGSPGNPPSNAVYRESPLAMIGAPLGKVDSLRPPMNVAGMSRTVLAGNGHLLEFSAIPRATEPDLIPPAGPETVFRAMRLDFAKFSETKPLKLPATPFDQWRTWKGPHPLFPDMQLQAEAAWWKGRVVSARVLYPWDQKPDAVESASVLQARDVALAVMVAIAAFFIILMARRNWTLGRADRLGAFHIALASFLLQAVAWAGTFHPAADMAILNIFLNAVADWLFGAAMLWFAYLALEPELRARWPHSIVTWNRVLAGRWRDAQVGSHILIGATAGLGIWIFFKAVIIFVSRNAQPTDWDVSLSSLLGARHWIGAHAAGANDALETGLFVFMTIFAMRQFLRKELLAALAAAAIFTMAQNNVKGQEWWLVALIYLVAVSALIYVLLRFGLVATIAAVFFINALNTMALGTDLNAWYIPSSIATLLLLLGIAILAFWRSLGGRALIEDANSP